MTQETKRGKIGKTFRNLDKIINFTDEGTEA